MNIRIFTILTAIALVGLPAACGKDSGGGKKSKPTPSPTPTPSDNPNANPKNQSTQQTQQNTFQNWEEFTNKAVAFQQSIGEDAAKFSLTAGTYETYFQNGQINRDADKTPDNVNGTLCIIRYKLFTTKSRTVIPAASRFLVSSAPTPEAKTSYNEAELEGNMQGGSEDRVSKIICRKHVDAGPITAGDLTQAFSSYVQVQTQ